VQVTRRTTEAPPAAQANRLKTLRVQHVRQYYHRRRRRTRIQPR
jgi:hypothetical protein